MGRYLPRHISPIPIYRDTFAKKNPILYRDTIPDVASHVTPTCSPKIAQNQPKIVEILSILLYSKKNLLNFVRVLYTIVIC